MHADQRDIATERIERRALAKAAWDWRGVAVWIAGVSAPLALGIGGFAHSTLWAHETRLATLETQRRMDDQQTATIRDELRSELRDLSAKIDRLLERRP